MKHSQLFTITSLVTILLFGVHVSSDVVLGYEPGTLSNYPAVLMMLAALYGTLVLHGRRSGLVIVLLFSLLGAVFPLAHMRGTGLGAAVTKDGVGVGFIAPIFVIGVTGLFTAILAVQGLWQLRRKADTP